MQKTNPRRFNEADNIFLPPVSIMRSPFVNIRHVFAPRYNNTMELIIINSYKTPQLLFVKNRQIPSYKF